MIRSIIHLEIQTGYSRQEIYDLIDELPDYYYHFAQSKGMEKGVEKFRHYNPSRKRLRDLHNRINDRIFSGILLPAHVQGCVRGRGNITNAKYHQGKRYKFHTDLRSYFDFVSNKMVYEALRRLGYSQKVSHLLTRLTTFQGHIPQGPPTSPFLANIAALPMDNEILSLVKDRDITYTRYVDDLCFSSQVDFQAFVPEILAIVKKHGFLFGHKKTYYKKGPLEITGAKVSNNLISPTAWQIMKYTDPNTLPHTRRGLDAYFKGLANS